MTRKTAPLALLATALLLGIAGCGDDDESSEESESTVTAEQALAEIDAVRTGLHQGLTQYETGNAEAAQTTVEDAYLEHFELVEGPLEEADAELNEDLEDLIREEIPDEMAAGAAQEDVETLVGEANDGLDQAEQLLEAG
jgi:hypothetical protein